MKNNDQMAQSDFNFRGLLETIFKGKKVIAIISIIAIVIGLVYSFFFVHTFYEEKTVLRVTPFNLESLISAEDNIYIDSNLSLPSMTIESFIEAVTKDEVLNATLAKLNSESDDGKLLTLSDLSGYIFVKQLEDSDDIEVICQGRNPELIMRITKALLVSYNEYIAHEIGKQLDSSIKLVSEQLKIKEENLMDVSESLSDYLRSGANIDILKAEITSLVSQIITLKAEQHRAEIQIAADSSSLFSIIKAIESAPDISIDDFEIIINLDEIEGEINQIEMNIGTDLLSKALLKIQISEIQNDLITNLSLKTALIDKTADLNEILTTNQIMVSEMEYEYNALINTKAKTEKVFTIYRQIHDDLMLIEMPEFADSCVTSVSKTTVTNSSDATDKMMNIAVAAVFGIMLGVFIVLIIDYWKTAKKNES